MNNREDVLFAQTAGLIQFNGGGTQYVIETPSKVLYLVYLDTGSDVAYRKSTDGGFTWSTPVVFLATSATALSVWYDRWSDISAGLIHIAYIESGTDNVWYIKFDTENNDAITASVEIWSGASTAAGGNLSITRARGGNIGVAYMIDAGAEMGFSTSITSGSTWSAKTSCQEATTDQIILVPGWAADNQDLMAFFWDASANEISRKLFDNSGNSWAETSIATSMTDLAAANAFPCFAASVDITNSRNLLVAWSGIAAVNADLRCWRVTESSITEVTNVILNTAANQGLCAIGIDAREYWYVFYCGKSDGTETFTTACNIYYKVSKDSGATWGPETKITGQVHNIPWCICTPRFLASPTVAWFNNITLDELMINISTASPKSSYRIGV